MQVSAIIVAGGSGQRLGASLPKQFQVVCGNPILYYTLLTFENCQAVADVVLVAPEDWLIYCAEEIVDRYEFRKVRKTVSGGAKRQDSVFAGLEAVDAAELVAVHDAVRPFVSSSKIAEVVGAAREFGAATLAIRPKDTIKVASGGFIETTPAREALWCVQTPQAFKYDLLRQAHLRAQEQGLYETDDAALVERLGHRIKLVEGEEKNFKITFPFDLVIAETLLRGES